MLWDSAHARQKHLYTLKIQESVMEEVVLQEEVRKDLLSLIIRAIRAIKQRDAVSLRTLSNRIIHSASIFQDELTISTAVIMYALSKILDRYGSIEKRITTHLKKIQMLLQQEKTKQVFKELLMLREEINTRDKRISSYVQHVINEARIKKGSRIYEHGISLAQTAKVLGVSQWEMMQYIGKTYIHEGFREEISVRQRLADVRKMFNT